MSYLKESSIMDFSRSREGIDVKSRLLKFSASEAKISIFLSHSHKDKDLVEGFIEMFAYHSGISVYVDWQDSTMPRGTNRETAQKIKDKINNLDFFLILGTKNALESRWVPWEIGIADTKKPLNRIAIIPVVNSDMSFQGNEYLQLYKRIVIASDKTLAVFPPNEDKGLSLMYWLSNP